MTYSLIIPIYNEKRTLSALLDKLDRLDNNIEIIIIDDGSDDETKNMLIESNKFIIKFCTNYKMLFNVSNQVFYPKPKVNSKVNFGHPGLYPGHSTPIRLKTGFAIALLDFRHCGND